MMHDNLAEISKVSGKSVAEVRELYKAAKVKVERSSIQNGTPKFWEKVWNLVRENAGVLEQPPEEE